MYIHTEETQRIHFKPSNSPLNNGNFPHNSQSISNHTGRVTEGRGWEVAECWWKVPAHPPGSDWRI